MKKQVLIIIDNHISYRYFENVLIDSYFEIYKARDGEAGLNIINQNYISLILIDLSLPTIKTLETLKTIREVSDIPIIVFSDVEHDVGISLMLRLGADDVIKKPVSIHELMARIHRFIRNPNTKTTANQKVYYFKSSELIYDTYEIRKNGEQTRLTLIEFRLLDYFINHPNQVLGRNQIINAVKLNDLSEDVGSLTKHILNLRTKIEHNPKKPQNIITVRNIGYLFIA